MIKKLVLFCFSALLLCCSLEKEDSKKSYTPQTEAGKTYKAHMNENMKVINSGMELFEEYGLLDSQSRSTEDFDLVNFIESIDSDLSSYTRKKASSGRTTEATETSLEEELNSLLQTYETAVEELAPKADDALKLDYIEKKDDVIIFADNIVINPKSIDGALALQVLNAEARGEDTDKVTQDIEKTIEDMFADSIIEDNEENRGHYTYNTFRYSKGKIIYYFDSSVSQTIKDEVRASVKDWETKTNRAVYFVEVPNNVAWRFLRAIGSAVVMVKEQSLDGANGRANLGRSFRATLWLDPSIKNNKNNLVRVPRHELGHIIGLHHEHQRWDRDTYIKFGSSSDASKSSTKKIGKNTKMIRLHVKKIRTWFGTIRIPYISYDTIRQSYTPTPYDYNSIMHYHAGQYVMRTKLARQGYKANQLIKMTTEISAYDAQTVKSWY